MKEKVYGMEFPFLSFSFSLHFPFFLFLIELYSSFYFFPKELHLFSFHILYSRVIAALVVKIPMKNPVNNAQLFYLPHLIVTFTVVFFNCCDFTMRGTKAGHR